MTWFSHWCTFIYELDKTIPSGAGLAERKRILRSSYPLGLRSGWRYKTWLKAQKRYLGRYIKSDNDVPQHKLRPLEILMKIDTTQKSQ